MDTNKYTSIQEIAKTHGLNYHTVRDRVRRLAIPCERVGWTIMIPKSHVPRIVGYQRKRGYQRHGFLGKTA